MPDGDAILISRDNVASSDAETVLRRDPNSGIDESPLFSVRNPVEGDGINSQANLGRGVAGFSSTDSGVFGFGFRFGVQGTSPDGNGVEGRAGAATPAVPTSGAGVAGTSSIGPGVVGITSSDNGRGVQGTSTSGPALEGRSTSSFGVRGISTSGGGVRGRAIGDGTGVYGSSGGIGIGVVGSSNNGAGVRGEGGQWGSQPRSGGPAVEAYGWGSVGVFAQSAFGDGIESTGPRAGVRGRAGGIISSAKNGVGVYGTSTVSGGAGVRGEHNGSNPGVEGVSSAVPV
jgi:hypothetical protein